VEKSVKDSFQRAQKDIVVDIVNDLNDHNILILKAISETREKFVKSVYERYKQLSRAHGLDGFSYVYFYNTLSYLQSLGLILLFSTKINRVYTNTINLTFEPSVINSIHNIRFEASRQAPIFPPKDI
jgi:Cdc6-like AAA superfamily ATPase